MTLHPPALSGPLHIDTLRADPAGTIGMTHCPGRCTVDASGRAWQRDVGDDVQTIRQAGYTTVITLLDDDELERLGVADLGRHVRMAGLRWLTFPIADYGLPEPEVWRAWCAALPDLVERLHADERLLIHCAGGFGRTGTLVATLLKTLGATDGDAAIARVRAVRPGTVETPGQEAFVRAFDPPVRSPDGGCGSDAKL